MRKIRLVYLTIGLDWGGVEKLLYEIAPRLDRDKFEIRVLAFRGEGPVGDHLREKDIQVDCLNGKGFYDFRTPLRLKRFLQKYQPDIVHAHLFEPNFISSLVKGDYKLVWHYHDMGYWMNFITKWLERQFVCKSDQVFVGSQILKETLLKRIPQLNKFINVWMNGVDTNIFRQASSQEKMSLRQKIGSWPMNVPVIGFVGRLHEPVKGLQYLVKSVPMIVKKNPKAVFVLVGDGKDRSFLQDLSKREGVESNIFFLGKQKSLDELYRCFDIFLLPSLSEASSISLIEASASGLPIVTTDVGGSGEIVKNGETGLLIPPADSNAIAEKITYLLQNKENCQKMGDAARARAEKLFSIEKGVKQLESFYRDMACLHS